MSTSLHTNAQNNARLRGTCKVRYEGHCMSTIDVDKVDIVACELILYDTSEGFAVNSQIKL